jgi:ubiquinone/menaquinone biosynthesis C-methylase UbiE
MLSHEEMIGLQAERHALIETHDFRSQEEYVLHLMHTAAYVQAARLSENKRVLDLGCNTGYGAEILSRVAKEVVGVDVSEKAISAAQDRYGHLGMKFQLTDGTRLPFENAEFDMIVSFQVIEHIVDYDVYIGELKRVVSPEGVVVFTTPNALLRLDSGMKPWNEFHVREFNCSELEALLATFFSNVQMMGLFANEPLYSIEANRLNRARESARRNAEGRKGHSRSSLRTVMKRVLPSSVLGGLRRVRTSVSGAAPAIDKSFMEQHGVDELFYRASGLESALDLLAICSDDEYSFERVRRMLGVAA